MKKIIFVVFLTIISLNSFSQNTIIGKWKPVFMDIEVFMTADLKTGKVTTAKQLDEMIAKNKELAQNKMMIEMMKTMLIGQLKGTTEEFNAKGVHILASPKMQIPITTKYNFDAKKKLLVIADIKTKKNQTMLVEFTKTGFNAVGEMQNPILGKASKMTIVYEKN